MKGARGIKGALARVFGSGRFILPTGVLCPTCFVVFFYLAAYADDILGGLLGWSASVNTLGSLSWFLALGFFLVGCLLLVLFSLSVWLGAERLKEHRLHRVDYFFTWLATVLALVLIVTLLAYLRHTIFAHILFVPCACALLMNLWTTTIVRLGAHTLKATTYWSRVLTVLPLRRFSGIFVMGTVAVGLLVILINSVSFLSEILGTVYYLDIGPLQYLNRYVNDLCLPAFVIVLTAILCHDIVRLDAEKEREVAERLREERLRSELITNVTHDIRTPLTSIINYVDLMQRPNIDEATLQEYLGTLSRKAAHLKGLTNDLLDAAKAGSGALPVNLQALDLAELVGQVAGDFDEALTAAGLTYVNPHAQQQVMVIADGQHLWRVLDNLFSNIAKYSLPGSRVYIAIEGQKSAEDVRYAGAGTAAESVRFAGTSGLADVRQGDVSLVSPVSSAAPTGTDAIQQEGAVTLRIKNISNAPLNISVDELMQRFVRGEKSRSSEGNGLGLYIAERLTTLMGGTLTLAIRGDLFEASITLPTPPAAT